MEITIKYGTVVICGPTSTGKTTLAKRILREMPWQECELVSHDEVLGSVLRPGMTQSEIDKQFRLTCLSLLSDGIKRRVPVIYEGKYYEKERLYAFLTLLSIMDPVRPICLIKMATDAKMQREFAMNRSGLKPTAKTVRIQNSLFEGVLETHYSEAPNIQEYVVTNPNDLKFRFLN